MELDQSLKNSETNVTDETASNCLLGPLLPLLLNSNSRKTISNRDWQGWLSSAQSGPAIDLTLAELCADIQQVAPDKNGTLKLRDVLSTASAHDLNEPPAHGVQADLLIVCTVWAAFKNKYPCETFESHLAKLDNLKAAVRADLALSPKKGEGELPGFWHVWRFIISLRGHLDRKIGEIAINLGDKWPSNRFNETLRDYVVDYPDQLLKRKNFGRIKLRTVIRCFAFAAIDSPSAPPLDGAISPYAAIELLRLPAAEGRCIKLRYGEGGFRTLDACGTRLGVTRERIRQIEGKVFEKLLILGHAESVKNWLHAQASTVWDELSNQGALIRRDTFSDSSYLRQKPELALGLAIVDLGVADLLDLVGERTEKGNWVYRA